MWYKVEKLIGSPDRPMSHDEIVAKFMENATSVMSMARAEQLREQVLNIEKVGQAREFAAALRL